MKSETLARNVTIPKRSGSEKVENGFSKWGQQIKAGLVNWSKKINSKTRFEAIITHPSVSAVTVIMTLLIMVILWSQLRQVSPFTLRALPPAFSEAARFFASDVAEDLAALTPLYSAAAEGRADVVEGLLEIMDGISVNELATTARRSPLWIACNNNHFDVVEILLANGANVELSDSHGSTPLLAASEEGHADIVRKLLQCGARRDVADVDGDTPLSLASAMGHKDVVNLLAEWSNSMSLM